MARLELTQVPGIGAVTAERLRAIGIDASLNRVDGAQMSQRQRDADFDILTDHFPMSYEPGTSLEIRMLLFPSFTGLLIYGTVIESSPASTDESSERYRHFARIEFSHIREQDRELLIRHLLRRQGDQMRERHGEDIKIHEDL